MPVVLRLQHTSVPMPPDGQEAARAFYSTVLGMQEVPPPSSLDAMRLVWFRAGDDGHEVHCFPDDDMQHTSTAQHLCLQVDDLPAYRARLEQHGVAVEDPVAIRNRPRLFVHDPFGNLIELTQIVGDYD